MDKEQIRVFRVGDIHLLDAVTGQMLMVDADNNVYVMISQPPPGKHRITNIYWDEDLQKIIIEKDSEPAK